MLTANRLEKVIELEDNLRGQYQQQLDAKTAEIDNLLTRNVKLKTELQSTIDKQLESIRNLSVKATANDRVEQQNRELTNRSEKQQAEISQLKKRMKSLQREMTELRNENKTLIQYDPARMRKNLDASKKKLAEKTKASEALQKSCNQAKRENVALQQQVTELKARVAELEPSEEKQEETAAI